MNRTKSCLSCKFFRPEDVYSGRCRVDKETIEPDKYPIMKHDDLCDRWKDAGQQYYIRTGWVANRKKRQQKRADA